MRVFRKYLVVCLTIILMLSTLAFTALAADLISEDGEAAEADAPVSFGLHHLAAATDMVVSAEVGELYYFTEADFLRAMNLRSLEYITVTEAPSAADGTLFLGASAVQSGQVISAGNLERMTYSSATGREGVGSFRFSCGESGYSLECRVYCVPECGERPTSAYAPEATVSASTYRGLSYESTLSGYDPDGDDCVFEIVSYPEHGAVRLLDRAAGRYVYTPDQGYTGEDSFRYVVRDEKGNYSTSREVTVSVSEPSISVEFVDLSSDSAVSSAIRMTECGIMSGSDVGGKTFFYPDATVSRVDFLVMAMRACGIEEPPTDEKTVFLDDGEIPASLRGYVAAAYSMGVVNGTFGEGGLYFLPDRAVTRAEAAKILSLLIEDCESASEELKRPDSVAVGAVTFDDGTSIPAWAEDAIYHLSAIGVYRDADGKASAGASLTRAETAEMLSVLLRVLEG
ncbi:MAG: S-layer homology domain-containing protein [Clostridia bacterium]|nr:S-layer homology domain-containing protein [Clostridia bacterium]